jgi:hypothetical protein
MQLNGCELPEAERLVFSSLRGADFTGPSQLTIKKGHPQPGRVRVRTGLRVRYGFALGAPTNPYLLHYAHVSRPWGSGFVQFLVTPS